MPNPFDHGHRTERHLRQVGFKSLGRNIRIANTCTILGVENIEIGSNVRIDGYTSIIAVGGHVRIGSYIHIAAYCNLAGGDGIEMHDFSGLSQGVKIYSRTDDYSGNSMTNPTVPAELSGPKRGAVTLGRHVIIGAGSVILPDLMIGEGAAVGALSLVTKSLDAWGVYFGSPVRRLKARSKRLLELEDEFLARGTCPPDGRP
jgi:galactoside O-acetyltransferase